MTAARQPLTTNSVTEFQFQLTGLAIGRPSKDWRMGQHSVAGHMGSSRPRQRPGDSRSCCPALVGGPLQ